MSVRNIVRGGLVSLALAFIGCYPSGPDDVSELDIVATFHKEGHDFSVNRTFAMPDTVVDISVEAGAASSLSHVHDAEIFAQIVSKMQDLGYIRVDGQVTKADVFVLVSGMSVEHTDVWYQSYPWYGYWGWYGGWGYYGYGPAYAPYYAWAPVVTQYDTGTIFISMVDPKASSHPDEVPVTWVATINGVQSGSDATISTRLSYLIPQAFDQSPYLAVQ